MVALFHQSCRIRVCNFRSLLLLPLLSLPSSDTAGHHFLIPGGQGTEEREKEFRNLKVGEKLRDGEEVIPNGNFTLNFTPSSSPRSSSISSRPSQFRLFSRKPPFRCFLETNGRAEKLWFFLKKNTVGDTRID